MNALAHFLSLLAAAALLGAGPVPAASAAPPHAAPADLSGLPRPAPAARQRDQDEIGRAHV